MRVALSQPAMQRTETRTQHNTHLGEAREVNERKVEHIRAVYAEVDGQLRHALVLARYAERLLLDFAPDLAKVDEALVEVQELAPLVATGCVDQLEHERPTRHDTLPARKKVAPDDTGQETGQRVQ